MTNKEDVKDEYECQVQMHDQNSLTTNMSGVEPEIGMNAP